MITTPVHPRGAGGLEARAHTFKIPGDSASDKASCGELASSAGTDTVRSVIKARYAALTWTTGRMLPGGCFARARRAIA